MVPRAPPAFLPGWGPLAPALGCSDLGLSPPSEAWLREGTWWAGDLVSACCGDWQRSLDHLEGSGTPPPGDLTSQREEFLAGIPHPGRVLSVESGWGDFHERVSGPQEILSEGLGVRLLRPPRQFEPVLDFRHTGPAAASGTGRPVPAFVTWVYFEEQRL